MRSNVEARIIALEIALKKALDQLRKAQIDITALQQQARQLSGQIQNPSSSTGTTASYWCISPSGGIIAASGVWPTITPTTFTAAIYQDASGTPSLVNGGATCRWFYKDSDPGNRLLPLTYNGDGSYDVIADSCTAVNV